MDGLFVPLPVEVGFVPVGEFGFLVTVVGGFGFRVPVEGVTVGGFVGFLLPIEGVPIGGFVGLLLTGVDVAGLLLTFGGLVGFLAAGVAGGVVGFL